MSFFSFPNLKLAAAATSGERPFQILVRTTSSPETYTLPAAGTYNVDWGDGTVDENVTGVQNHSYATAGDYQIKITGGLTQFGAGINTADRANLRDTEYLIEKEEIGK